MEIYQLTIHEARSLLKSGDISLQEILEGVIDRIVATEAKTNSFISFNIEGSIEQVSRISSKKILKDGSPFVMGIPMGIQDNICAIDHRMTAASRVLSDFMPPYDASVIKRLRQSHCVIMGKLNMDEFGIGAAPNIPPFKSAKNPWNLKKTPGRGAGGCGAAVSTGQVFYAIGSDSSGCLRQSAAFCGVVGFKPTYGLVSRYGLASSSPSMEQIGCITKDVKDCVNLIEEIIFYDVKDARSIKIEDTGFNNALVDNLQDFAIGIPKEIFDDTWDPQIRKAVDSALIVLEKLGACLVDISLPHSKYASAVHYIIQSSEAASSLGKYDGIRYGGDRKASENLDMLYFNARSLGFNKETKRRIILGNLFLSSKFYDSYYQKALSIRELIREDFKKAYKLCDTILTPASPILSFNLDSETAHLSGIDKSFKYTLLANLAGLPAITIPCGRDNEDMPIGIQFIGDMFCERKTLRVAYAYESNTDFNIKEPGFREEVQ